MYICRGDKDRDMDTDMNLDKVRPYLIALIDKKKNIWSKDTTRYSNKP